MRRLSAQLIQQLNPSEARRVRRASVIGETEAHVIATLVVNLKNMDDRRFSKFVCRFRRAVNGGEDTFHPWLTKLVVKQGALLNDLDEQLLRDEIFKQLKPYLHR